MAKYINEREWYETQNGNRALPAGRKKPINLLSTKNMLEIHERKINEYPLFGTLSAEYKIVIIMA